MWMCPNDALVLKHLQGNAGSNSWERDLVYAEFWVFVLSHVHETKTVRVNEVMFRIRLPEVERDQRYSETCSA